jgi:predicted MFS family arabinose efflux permease
MNALHPDGTEICACVASAIMNASMALGDLVGPVIGGYSTKYLGFSLTCQIAGLYMLINSILFIPTVLQYRQLKKSV